MSASRPVMKICHLVTEIFGPQRDLEKEM